MTRYLIGIDLGTTNSALAYVDLQQKPKSGRPKIHTFPCPQLVAPGELGDRSLLPSFLYLPGPHDLPPGSVALPWAPDRDYAIGEFARNHGAKVPGRLVASAKSWLCHAGVDRSAALLPWSAPPDVPRVSPVEASARYLRHFVQSWNHRMAREREQDRLENQAIVLTVPASFDDVARNLTVDAARQAGLDNLTLLEEPQAAFYSWFATVAPEESRKLQPGARCLVLDVGGGTSDFSLIRAVEEQGGLGFVRDAVGDHLLLGGDNMDLALAKFAEGRLGGAGRLDAAQYGMLAQACRGAKEALLGAAPPASYSVTIMGRGRQVIGGSLTTSLTGDEVRRILFEGFFPEVPADAQPQRGARAGLHEMGLPYVNDPAITRHLAQFLNRHASEGMSAPSAILFNGGVFQPAALRERILDVMRTWYAGPQAWDPLLLTSPSLDLAVAWGAAHYAWLRHTGGRRIGGGLARSYYLGVDATTPASAKKRVLCVVPQHLEEGREVLLSQPELEIALGQPVTFPLYSSTVRDGDKAGDVVEIGDDQMLAMPPLHTILRGGKRSGVKRAPVTLAAKATEVGTLELSCVAKDGGNRWRLEFNVRDVVPDAAISSENVGDDGPAAPTDIWPEPLVQEALRLLQGSFAGSPPVPTPQELTKALEAALEAPRHEWPTGLCRRLWEPLLQLAEHRRRTPPHSARWYNLVGFCLRPGFGDALDRFRIDQLWKLLNSLKRDSLQPDRQVDGGAEFWVLWRRVSGGLNAPLQRSLLDRLRPVLLPGKGRGAPKPGANEVAEMWRAAASLERLDAKVKENLGDALLKLLRRGPVPTYAFWALTRLGARSLLYGPLNAVVHPTVAQRWLETILPFKASHESERLGWAFCLCNLARRSGQRALDVEESLARRVLAVLHSHAIPHHWKRMVEEVTELETSEKSQLFGESLPIGLRLVSESIE